MSYLAIDMKTCKRCNTEKELTGFHKHSGFKDGYRLICKACRKDEHVERYVQNKTEWNKRTTQWRLDNPEKVDEINKKQRIKHKEKRNTQTAEWKKQNKDRVNFLNMTRYASKLERTPKWLSKEQLQEINEFYTMAKELENVFPWKQHVDHVVPLQGDGVSGLHVPWNLQILSAKDNITKGNRYNG